MLLERIDIDSRGTHARVQLGPFSNRLNVVFGPPGSGKTATIEFVRSVMLGTDRHWRHGVNGAVVWADRNGLLHCRRELDGTTLGRLMVDYVDRNGPAKKQATAKDPTFVRQPDRYVRIVSASKATSDFRCRARTGKEGPQAI